MIIMVIALLEAGNSFGINYLKAGFSYQQHIFLMTDNRFKLQNICCTVLKGIYIHHHWRALHIFTTPSFLSVHSLSLCFSVTLSRISPSFFPST